MANFFSSLFGTDPKIMTKSVTDPLKQNVATPLSSYLQTQVGQGLPSYSGQMVAPLPSGGGASVAPFLGMTAQQLEGKTNAAAENEFKNSFDANVLEKNAGALSSSGAGQNINASETALQLGLAQQDVGIEESLPKEQLGVAQGLANQQTSIDQAAYQSWSNSLSQNNPALGQALTFLSNQTSSGTSILSALDPGSSSSLIDLLQAGSQASSASSQSSQAASLSAIAAAAM